MAKKHQIVVNFEIDGKKGKMTIDGLDRAVKQLARNTRTAATRFSEIGNIVTGFNSAISIISKLQSTVIGLVNTYKKQEQAEKQLNTALGKNAQGLIDYAASLQAVTTHGDEEIIRAESMLAAYTKDENQIKQLTKATLDFADAMGVDLETAASLVGKTVGSSTNALARYGIQVEGAVGTTERFESIISSINEKFGGQAEALAQTETGKYTQAMNELGDQMERLGKALAPVVGKMANLTAVSTKGVVNFLMPAESHFEKMRKTALEEKIAFDQLINTYEILRQKTNKTTEEKRRYSEVISELMSKYPNYFKDIDFEKDSYEKIQKAISSARVELEKYLRLQIRKAALKDKSEEIAKKDEELLEIEEKIAKEEASLKFAQETYEKLKSEGEDIAAGSWVRQIEHKKQLIEEYKKEANQLSAEIDEAINKLSGKYSELKRESEKVVSPSSPRRSGGSGSNATPKPTKPLKIPVELEFPSADEVFADWEDTETEFTNREIERYEELQRRKQEIDELRLETIQDTKERELAYLEMEYQADLERYKNVAGAKAVIDQLYAQKKEQIEFQSFLRSSQIINQSIGNFATLFNRQSETFKTLSATQAVISTITGAAAAVQPPPVGAGPVLGPILAASIVAAGMARVHQIMAQNVPKFATGGIVTGSSHANGGVVIEAEGGEYIVNRRATQENLELLEAINSGSLYGFSSLKEGFLLLARKIEEQTQRLESVERVISVSQLDEIYSRYQEEKRMVGLE